jgi:hypothetical protein
MGNQDRQDSLENIKIESKTHKIMPVPKIPRLARHGG